MIGFTCEKYVYLLPVWEGETAEKLEKKEDSWVQSSEKRCWWLYRGESMGLRSGDVNDVFGRYSHQDLL